jgi:hypothetical protein
MVQILRLKIYVDNQGAMLAKNPEYHARTKHIDTQWHCVQEQVGLGTVELCYVSTNDQVADGLTKALGGEKFRKDIGLHKVNHSTAKARSAPI